MSKFTDDSLALLLHLYNHGPITADEFKESFPKLTEPAGRLNKLVRGGVLRRVGGQFLVTDRGRDVLKEHGLVVAIIGNIAQPRTFQSHGGTYNGQRMTPMRAGADDHLRIPSLIGGERVYRRLTNA